MFGCTLRRHIDGAGGGRTLKTQGGGLPRAASHYSDAVLEILERAKGFEPSTPTLAKKAAANDLRLLAIQEHSIARTSAKENADGAPKLRGTGIRRSA